MLNEWTYEKEVIRDYIYQNIEWGISNEGEQITAKISFTPSPLAVGILRGVSVFPEIEINYKNQEEFDLLKDNHYGQAARVFTMVALKEDTIISRTTKKLFKYVEEEYIPSTQDSASPSTRIGNLKFDKRGISFLRGKQKHFYEKLSSEGMNMKRITRF